MSRPFGAGGGEAVRRLSRPPAENERTSRFDITNFTRPSLIVFRSPWCHHCRAMQSDLDDLAAEYAAMIDMVTIDISRNMDVANAFRVRSTPTLVGVRSGSERFRKSGRSTRSELHEMFAALGHEGQPKPLAVTSSWLSWAAAACLTVVGVLGGPNLPLLLAAGGVLAHLLGRHLRGRRARPEG